MNGKSVHRHVGVGTSQYTNEQGLLFGHQPSQNRPIFVGNLNGFITDYLLCLDCLWGQGWKDVFYLGEVGQLVQLLYLIPLFSFPVLTPTFCTCW